MGKERQNSLSRSEKHKMCSNEAKRRRPSFLLSPLLTHLDEAAPEAVDHGVESGGRQRERLSKYRGDEDAAEAENSAILHQSGRESRMLREAHAGGGGGAVKR